MILQIQLSWTDLETGSLRQPVLETPVALGREFALMPGVLEGERVSRVVLSDDRINPFHALIVERQGELIITDQNSRAGVKVNGVTLPSSTLAQGDRLQIGPFQLQISLLSGAFSLEPGGENSDRCSRMVGFLFKRRCNRTDATGCPHCQTGQAEDPYFYARSYYPDYGTYTYGHWGSDYYSDRDHYSYNPETRSVDFTEADSTAFAQEGEMDYEQDLGAS